MSSFSFRMVLSIIGVIVVVILGLIGWCIWRFCKKKRPKGAEDKDKQDDENALVDNEEANVEEVNLFSRKKCLHMSVNLLSLFFSFSPNSLRKRHWKKQRGGSVSGWNMILLYKNLKSR